jgi:hypothetical protein
MKQFIIASLVGGIILFFWQFLSWTALDLHRVTSEYTSSQESVLKCLSENIQPGFYYLPTTPKGTSQEDNAKFMTSVQGQPWAQIYYHKSFNPDMTQNMIRGVLVNIVTMLLLCWIIVQCRERKFKDTLLISLTVGLIGYLTGTYSNAIWFEYPTMPDLIDALAGFGLVGVWLGWYLKS